MEDDIINNLDISNFFPQYPSVNHNNFYQKIYEKEEFYKERFLKDKKNKEDVLKHQILVARFLSPYTPYDRLLLFHDPGTGKTCTGINAYEFFRNEESKEKFVGAIKKKKFNGAIIIAISQTPLLDNFREQIINICSESSIYEKKIEEIEEEIDDDEEEDDDRDYEEKFDPIIRKKKRILKEVKKHYTFMTISQIVNKYKSANRDDLLEQLSNKVIIVDEAHKLKPSEGEDVKCKACKGTKKINNIECKKCKGKGIIGVPSQEKYDIFHNIFHQIKDSKVLFLTGTPIRDKVKEIFILLNLLLPEEKNVDLRQNYENNKDWLNDDFKKIIQGYVSYIKTLTDPKVKVNYVKNGNSDFYESYMQDLQNKVYMKEFEEKGGGIEKGILFKQITNLVLPSIENKNEGIYGNNLFDAYIKAESKENKNGTKSIQYNLKKKNFEKNLEKKEELEELKNYSAKYHDIIKLIMDNPTQKVFVFGEIRVGSGLIMFTKILGKFISKKTIKLISSVNKNQIKSIFEKFNSPKNKDGKDIRVIVGTDITGEGITLKNIEQIHIVNPWYNYGKIIQAVARGIRFGSHEYLIKERKNENVTVNVYLHVSIPTKNNQKLPEDSEDLALYKISDDKNKEIKTIERILKESAIDCQLEYERNYVDSEDGSRECDYSKCKYECEGITNKNPDIDYNNYELIYSKTSTIVEKIKELFSNNFSLKINKIQKKLGKDYTIFEIIKALNEITTKNLSIKEYENKNTINKIEELKNKKNKLDENITKHETIVEEIRENIDYRKGIEEELEELYDEDKDYDKIDEKEEELGEIEKENVLKKKEEENYDNLKKLKEEFEKAKDDLQEMGDYYEEEIEKNKIFLKEYNNVYYLSNFIQTPSNSLNAFYESNKTREISKNFFDIYILDFIQSFIKFLNDTKIDKNKIFKIMENNLEILDKEIQEIIIEEAKLSEVVETNTNKQARQFILKYYSKHLHENSNYYICNFLGKNKLRCLNKMDIKKIKSGGNCNSINKNYKELWKNCDEKYGVDKKVGKINIEDPTYYGYYGEIKKNLFNIKDVSTILKKHGVMGKIVNKKLVELDENELNSINEMLKKGEKIKEISGKFNLKIDGRKKSRSKACKSWKKEDLFKEIIPNLNIKYENEFDVKIGENELTVNNETSIDDIKKFIKTLNIIKKIETINDISKLYKILFVISKLGIDDNKKICNFIEESFRNNNLLIV